MSKNVQLLKPTNDYVFKRIFSYEGKENITKDFIEAVTNYKISDINIEKTTILEKDLPDDKIGILDVRAVLDGNIQTDIEMQMVKHDNIEKRILYYWSKLYSSSIAEGADYINLNKTIVILVSEFELDQFKEIPKFHTEFEIREKDFSEIILTDVLEIHIISLSKMLEMLNNNKLDKTDKLNIWSMFLINPDKIGGTEMSENKNIEEAKKILDDISKDKEEKRLAELREKYILDQISIRNTGYRQGLAEGLAEGERKKQEEIAKKLISLNIDLDKIIVATGLTKEEINKLK